MSTRATYQFPDGITIYVHYDGYPEGAAAYFYDALMWPNKRGGLSHAFLRANDLAELTTHHRDHTDTDYRYTLSGKDHGPATNVIVEKRRRNETDPDRYDQIYAGSLRLFIDENRELIEEYRPFRQVTLRTGGDHWLNETTAAAYLAAPHGPLDHLRGWNRSKCMTRQSSNWRSCANELQQIVDAFPELRTDEIDELLREEPTGSVLSRSDLNE